MSEWPWDVSVSTHMHIFLRKHSSGFFFFFNCFTSDSNCVTSGLKLSFSCTAVGNQTTKLRNQGAPKLTFFSFSKIIPVGLRQ